MSRTKEVGEYKNIIMKIENSIEVLYYLYNIQGNSQYLDNWTLHTLCDNGVILIR